MLTLDTKFSIKDYRVAFMFVVKRHIVGMIFPLAVFILTVCLDAFILKDFGLTLYYGIFLAIITGLLTILLIYSYYTGAKVAARGGETSIHIEFNADDVIFNEYANDELYSKATLFYSDFKEIVLLKSHILIKTNAYLSLRLDGTDLSTLDKLKDLFCHKMPMKRIKKIRMNLDKYRKQNKIQ